MLSKKSLAVILAAIIIFIIIASQIASAKSNYIDGSTNAKRILYLKSIGVEVASENVSSKRILIPEKFNDIYNNYNTMQKQAGFDLSHFKGKKATIYTYSLNSEYNVNIIVCEDRIIGGDIAALNINGEMKPLCNKK